MLRKEIVSVFPFVWILSLCLLCISHCMLKRLPSNRGGLCSGVTTLRGKHMPLCCAPRCFNAALATVLPRKIGLFSQGLREQSLALLYALGLESHEVTRDCP